MASRPGIYCWFAGTKSWFAVACTASVRPPDPPSAPLEYPHSWLVSTRLVEQGNHLGLFAPFCLCVFLLNRQVEVSWPTEFFLTLRVLVTDVDWLLMFIWAHIYLYICIYIYLRQAVYVDTLAKLPSCTSLVWSGPKWGPHSRRGQQVRVLVAIHLPSHSCFLQLLQLAAALFCQRLLYGFSYI